MPQSFAQVFVKCPYYKGDDGKNYISCEGIIPDTDIRSRFKTKQDYMMQMDLFCCSEYWRCEICDALDHRYMMEEENDG